MNERTRKHELPMQLSKLYRKQMGLGFKRIILYQSEPQRQQVVGHYDYSCEGLVALIAIFKKKQQAHMIKAFSNIKYNHQRIQKRTPSFHSKLLLEITTGQNGIKKQKHQEENYARSRLSHQLKHDKKTINQNQQLWSNVKPYQGKLEGILIRLKEVNSVTTASDRQQHHDKYELKAERSTFCPGNSRSRQVLIKSKINLFRPERQSWQVQTPNSLHLYKKRSRREFILNKISEIEANLCELTHNRENLSADYNEEIQNATFNFRQQLHTVQASKMERY